MFNSNGFLIVGKEKRYGDVTYYGIDSDPWPIDEDELVNAFNAKQVLLFENMLDELNPDNTYGMLADQDMMVAYTAYCIKHKHSYRVLYLETNTSRTCYSQTLHDKYGKIDHFMGYDVGFCSCNFYSALLPDVIIRPELLGNIIYSRINEYGLFDSMNSVNMYLDARAKAKLEMEALTFEEGNLMIIAVYSVNA